MWRSGSQETACETWFDSVLAYTHKLDQLLANYIICHYKNISTQHIMSTEISTCKIEIYLEFSALFLRYSFVCHLFAFVNQVTMASSYLGAI